MSIFIIICFLASTFDFSNKKASTSNEGTAELMAETKETLVTMNEDSLSMIPMIEDNILNTGFSLKNGASYDETQMMEVLDEKEIISYETTPDSANPIEVEKVLADNGDPISMETLAIVDNESLDEQDIAKEASPENNDTDVEKATEEASDEQEEEKEALYANIGISIAKDYVNVRKSPNTDSDILGKLYRNSAATILDVDGEWYHIESGSVVGYVKADYLLTGLSDDELLSNYATQKIKVATDGLNVRKEPDQESERLTCIYLGETYPVVEVLDEWVKVDIEDDGVVGYVKKEYADIIARFTSAVSKKEEEEKKRIEAEKRAAQQTAVIYRDGVSYSEEDLKLLAALVHAEAGNQCYEGKLAVANVVLNRVKSSKYPNSISKVIYQSGQFTVAKSGSLAKQLDNYENYSSESQKLTIKAAKAALEGANNIGNRLYFNAYKTAVKKGYLEKYSTCVKIEDHLFW